jgi:AsmA protein
MGVTLPAGSSLQGGSATADLAIDGPVDRLVTTGPIDLQNVKLAGYSVGSKIGALASLAGIKAGSDTNIQTMSSKLRIAPEGIRADALNVVVTDLGTVTGAGTVGADNTLNFHLVAKLANAGGVVGGLSKIAGGGSDKGIPIVVSGTTSNPVFAPDLTSTMKNVFQTPASGAQQGVQGIGGVIGGFLNKKKPNQ